MKNSPGWCGSVDWVPACKPKGRGFHSQSGHMPGLWARSPVGAPRETTTHWGFSPSLPLSPSSHRLLSFPPPSPFINHSFNNPYCVSLLVEWKWRSYQTCSQWTHSLAEDTEKTKHSACWVIRALISHRMVFVSAVGEQKRISKSESHGTSSGGIDI